MRFLLGLVIGLVLGAAAVGGSWWYSSRDSEGPSTEEELLARASADQLLEVCEDAPPTMPQVDCELVSLEDVGPSAWRARIRDEAGDEYCVLIRLDRDPLRVSCE